MELGNRVRTMGAVVVIDEREGRPGDVGNTPATVRGRCAAAASDESGPRVAAATAAVVVVSGSS